MFIFLKLQNFEINQEFYTYNEAMLGQMKSDPSEFVMIEEFISGKFFKYVNNDGGICTEQNELVDKAKCLEHFSMKSQIMSSCS